MKAEEFRRRFAECINDAEPPQQVVIGNMDLAGHLDVDSIRATRGFDERTDTPFNEIVIDVGIPKDLFNIGSEARAIVNHTIHSIRTLENAYNSNMVTGLTADLERLDRMVINLAIMAGINHLMSSGANGTGQEG